MNIETKEIEALDFLVGDFLGMKFSGLYYYNGMIWMIPWNATHIYVVYINDLRYECIPLPKEISNNNVVNQFRKSIIHGKYLWLLPSRFPGIIRIDMEEKNYKIFNGWPTNVRFDKNKKMNFKMMYLYEDNLYLFRDACNMSIRLSIHSGKMFEWKEGDNVSFGVIWNNKLYTSPVNEFSPIKIIKFENSPQQFDEKYLPDILWMNKKHYIYSYWYGEILLNKAIFMPHEAYGVLIMDLDTEQVKIVDVNISDYKTQRKHKNYAVYEVIEYKNNFLLIPYQGNKIVVIDGKGEIKEEYLLETDVWFINNVLNESEQYNIQKYLEKVNLLKLNPRSLNIRNDNFNLEIVGKTIHKSMSREDKLNV